MQRCADFSGGFGEELTDIGASRGKEGCYEEVPVGGDAVAVALGDPLDDPMRAEEAEIPARLRGGTSLVFL